MSLAIAMIHSQRSDTAASADGLAVMKADGPIPAQKFGQKFASDTEEEDEADASDFSPGPLRRKPEEQVLRERSTKVTKAEEAREERAKREKLLAFLKKHRFQDVNSSRGWFQFYYPLHAAVQDNDVDMVCLLLHFKARRSLKDSNGLTPYKLAKQMHEQAGTHREIIKVFVEHKAGRQARNAARRARRALREAAKEAKLCRDLSVTARSASLKLTSTEGADDRICADLLTRWSLQQSAHDADTPTGNTPTGSSCSGFDSFFPLASTQAPKQASAVDTSSDTLECSTTAGSHDESHEEVPGKQAEEPSDDIFNLRRW